MIIDFINQYGATILYALITAVAGYVGLWVKKLVKNYLDTREKREIARACVGFVEQVYQNLHGEEKLAEAIRAASEMLAQKGIAVTELELRVLLEAAVAEFNNAFQKQTASMPTQ